MRKEFIDYIFVFDKTFGLVSTYQHKNEGLKPRSSWYRFQSECIAFNQKIKFERHEGLENGFNELVLFGF